MQDKNQNITLQNLPQATSSPQLPGFHMPHPDPAAFSMSSIPPSMPIQASTARPIETYLSSVPRSAWAVPVPPSAMPPLQPAIETPPLPINEETEKIGRGSIVKRLMQQPYTVALVLTLYLFFLFLHL